mgnify:CR=1 FL=1
MVINKVIRINFGIDNKNVMTPIRYAEILYNPGIELLL